MDEQGTEAWLQARAGKATASRAGDVLAKIRSGESASRYNYKAQLVTERLTGLPTDSYTSAEMQWGIDHEAEARAVYEAVNDVEVIETGFKQHNNLDAGASPDGLVGTDGLIEIKCPNSISHIKTIIDGTAPKKYIPQMMMQMWITNRKWCDFVSYDPRLDPKNAYFCVRVERDDEYIANLEKEVTAFLIEVDELVTKLKERK